MENIILHCFYTGKNGDAKKFIDEMYAGGYRDAVLAEDGCLQYDYFISAADPEVGALMEKWRDKAALDAHTNGEPMRALKAVKAKYDLETKVERYE